MMDDDPNPLAMYVHDKRGPIKPTSNDVKSLRDTVRHYIDNDDDLAPEHAKALLVALAAAADVNATLSCRLADAEATIVSLNRRVQMLEAETFPGRRRGR